MNLTTVLFYKMGIRAHRILNMVRRKSNGHQSNIDDHLAAALMKKMKIKHIQIIYVIQIPFLTVNIALISGVHIILTNINI